MNAQQPSPASDTVSVRERPEEKPEKTRVRRRKDARPAEILAAGMVEFGEHGFERARLDRIAANAGIAKGTIYLYFPSKEALFFAAVEEHVLSLMAETESDLMRFEGTTRELLRLVMTRAYGKIVRPENQAIMRMLVGEGHRVPEITAKYHDMVLARGCKIMEAIIARGVARGEIKPSVVTQHPDLMFAPAMYVAINKLVFGELDDIDVPSFFEGHLEMLARGLGLDPVT